MLDSIKNEIKSIFSEDKFSIGSVVIFSITLFYILVTFYAISVFTQFNYIEVISVSLVFLILLILMATVFLGSFFRQPLKFSIYNIFIAILSLVIMLFLLNSISSTFFPYYHLFPLLETELGLGWHQDTAFHTSLIQNILNFGYPSIGQHGTPITVYHVLSHYIDALILAIIGLEPYDSYTLLFYFKGFLLLSSITIFIAYVFKEFSGYMFVVFLLFFAPIIISDWHGIGSHGLWFTTILLLLSMPKVFDIIQLEYISIKSFLFLFLLIIFISFGKISTGFMYASFIGFFLLIKRPKDIFIYILGIAWVIFFLLYTSLMTRNTDKIDTFDFSWLNLNLIYEYFPNINLLDKDFSNIHVLQYEIQTTIFATISFWVIYTYIFKNRQNLIVFITAIINFIILVFITKSTTRLNLSDTWYFYFGFSSVFILFTILSLPYTIRIYIIKDFHKLNNVNKKLIIVGLIFSSMYLSSFYTQPSFKLESEFLNRNIAVMPNKDKLAKTKVIFLKKYLDKKEYRPLKVFRDNLYAFMKYNQITKNQLSLYIPKEIFEQMSIKFEGYTWANGMLIYAITGVPLVHGIKELRKDYAYSEYKKDNLWMERSRFKAKKVCESITSKYIIITDSLFDPKFDLYKCDR